MASAPTPSCRHMCVHGYTQLLQLCLTLQLWISACQPPLSMGFSRHEYWSGLPCPPSGDLPDPGIEPKSLKSPALAGGFFTTSATWKPVSPPPTPGHKLPKNKMSSSYHPFPPCGGPCRVCGRHSTQARAHTHTHTHTHTVI